VRHYHRSVRVHRGRGRGAYAFIAAGAVVREDVPDFALMAGVPAKRIGWMSRHGDRLAFDQAGRATCPATGEAYVLADGLCRRAGPAIRRYGPTPGRTRCRDS